MPDDAYFEQQYSNDADDLDTIEADWDKYRANLRYENACITFSRIVSKALRDYLSDNEVEDLLINLLPWNSEESEEQIMRVVRDAVEKVELSYWELGDILIDSHFFL